MKRSRLLRSLMLGLIAILVAAAPSLTAAALDYKTLKFFADNNIIYYDPSLRAKCSSALDCNIAGDTRDEKLWSGLRNLGLTPEQTAAMMGNIFNEGGSPVRQEDAYNFARNKGCLTSNGTPYTIWDDVTNGQYHTSCMAEIYSTYGAGTRVAGIGLGFVGWTAHSRRLGYLQLIQDAGLIKYFDGDAYKVYGRLTDDALHDKIVEETGSEADYWALWCTALKYIYYELTTPHDGMDYTHFFELTDVAEMAAYIAERYEVCSECKPGQPSHDKRVRDAEAVYQRYQNGEFAAIEGGTATQHNFGAGTLTDGSKVTIIGDSITNGAQSAIRALMPEADIISQHSKSFAYKTGVGGPTGQEIVAEMAAAGTLRDIVVIALGTNNYGPYVTTTEIETMIATIGANHNIIFVNNYDDVEKDRYDTNNQRFDAAATKYDTTVSIVDWKGIVQSAEAANPGKNYLKHESAYAVHPTDLGNELFAQAIADGVTGRTKSLNNCATDLITDPSQAVSYLQQFIIDTNHRYDTNYALPPADAQLNVALETPADDSVVGDGGGCWGATYCGQCTALSGWFIQMMTNLTFGGTGDGRDTVGKTASANAGSSAVLHSLSGQFPTGVAIFSMQGGTWGHTGVVLGRTNDGEFITIENNQRNAAGQPHRLEIMTRSEEVFRSRSTTFYPVDVVKVEHLGTTY